MDDSEIRHGDSLLVILDDASRLIVGWARTPIAAAEIAWSAFETAGRPCGFPKEILTRHGTQFTKVKCGRLSCLDRKLRALQRRRGIHIPHFLERIQHPPTAGRVERVFGAVSSMLRARRPDGVPQFDLREELVAWYNEGDPRLGLNFEKTETPLPPPPGNCRPSRARGI
jgi:transposase InsO family protein